MQKSVFKIKQKKYYSRHVAAVRTLNTIHVAEDIFSRKPSPEDDYDCFVVVRSHNPGWSHNSSKIIKKFTYYKYTFHILGMYSYLKGSKITNWRK